jgi:hypothetical protein
MPKKKIDPIDQIHKLCRENRIVPLLIQDEDFTEIYEDIKFSNEDLDELKSALYDALMNDFGNSLEQTLFELGYNHSDDTIESDH